MTPAIRTPTSGIDGAGGTLAIKSPFNSVTPQWVEIEFDTGDSWSPDPQFVDFGSFHNFYSTALHEIGHAIGLAHNFDPGSIMYPYDNGTITLGSGDIADIQSLYGATPRPVSAVINGTSGDDTLQGSSENNTIDAGAGSDRIHPGGGYDIVFGGDGLDFTLLDGNYRDYVVVVAGDTAGTVDTRLFGSDDLDAYDHVERLVFYDGVLATDVDGTNGAGAVYRIYQAAFDRTPDVGGLTYWTEQADKAMSTIEMAARFIDSDEFRHLYGSSSPPAEQFITLIYRNVLHRDPDQGGHDFWTGQLAHGMSEAEMLARFADSAENRADVIGAISNGIWLNTVGDYG